jgi:hypothetical protein
VAEYSVTGLTSNPTIFDRAIKDGTAYDADIAARQASGATDEQVFFDLALADLRRAADLLAPVHARTDGVDGWVSLEVSPLLAHDTPRAVDQAESLHREAALDNLFIKIPGTAEGLTAVEECIYAGVPVNVTLLFSAEQYRAAAEAYLRGVQRRIRAELDLAVGSDLVVWSLDRLHRLLRESQILRVDHFLGKEPVIELEYLRFANLALAELWERTSVSAVQITMAEDFGVEGRGRFYDSVGALRDVVQNHLLQVLALVAMDPPAGGSAGDTQDKKAEVFRAMPPADPQHYVRGQYQGYADIPGVGRASATETYVALRLEIDNWRWADVPVFLRAGKALPHRVTEVRLLLRRTPRLAFLPQPARAEPNQVVLRIDPDPGLRLQLSALAGQSWRPVHLDTSFARELGEPAEPYERLLHAALAGDHQLFARQDSVEETWRIVQPLLDHPPDVRSYPRGSWGPDDAEALVRGHPRWQSPWLPADG